LTIPPPPAAPASRPETELPVYASCAATLLLTFLPWLRIDGFPGPAEPLGELGRSMESMFRSMQIEISVAGIDLWPGVFCLIGAAACAALTWADGARVLTWDRGTTRLAASAAAALAAGSALYALLRYEGMRVTIWSILAFVVAGGATWFSYQRLREHADSRARELPPA
jgi:hypothetical protein